MGNFGRYLLVALIAAAAAIGASWVARSMMAADHHAGGALHSFVHEQLDLDPAQEAKIEELEAQFAQRRTALEAKLRAANGELAQARPGATGQADVGGCCAHVRRPRPMGTNRIAWPPPGAS